MSYKSTLEKIRSVENELEPTYLLYGLEQFFIENIKNAIISRLSNQIEDYAIYDLRETPIQEVINDAETFPFFAEHKLIIAYYPIFLQARPDSLPFTHELETIENYLQNPVDYTTFILIAPYEKIDQRKRITKIIKQNATVVKCELVRDYHFPKWIKYVADECGVIIEEDAYEIFEAAVNTNLFLLHNEIEKMKIYLANDNRITRKIAEKLISYNQNQTALMLVDAVLEKDLQKALNIFHTLLKRNEEPIGLIALLSFQFRTILQVKHLQNKGYSEQQMEKQIAAHPFVIKLASKRARNLSASRLQQIVIALAETDASIKKGTIDEKLAFDLLLNELIH